MHIVPILVQSVKLGWISCRKNKKFHIFLHTLGLAPSWGVVEGGVINPVVSVGFNATDSALPSFEFIRLFSAAVLVQVNNGTEQEGTWLIQL